MKFIKFTERGRIDKYVSESAVITFIVSRDKIFVNKKKHAGKREYIEELQAK